MAYLARLQGLSKEELIEVVEEVILQKDEMQEQLNKRQRIEARKVPDHAGQDDPMTNRELRTELEKTKKYNDSLLQVSLEQISAPLGPGQDVESLQELLRIEKGKFARVAAERDKCNKTVKELIARPPLTCGDHCRRQLQKLECELSKSDIALKKAKNDLEERPPVMVCGDSCRNKLEQMQVQLDREQNEREVLMLEGCYKVNICVKCKEQENKLLSRKLDAIVQGDAAIVASSSSTVPTVEDMPPP